MYELTMTVWYRKTRMVWLPDSEKIFEDTITSFDTNTNLTDSKTDRQTANIGKNEAEKTLTFHY